MTPAARFRPLDGAVDDTAHWDDPAHWDDSSNGDDRASWEIPAWAARLRAHHLSSRAGSGVVLVIDDRGDKRTSWCHSADVLRFAGYTVIEATAGDDASRMLAHMRFDAIVLEREGPRTRVVQVQGGLAAANLEASVGPEDLVGAVAGAVVAPDR